MKRQDLFDLKPSGEKPTAETLLVAQPLLREAWFNHAVIALVDDPTPENSPMGIVLNRATNVTLDNLIDGLRTSKPITVFCGGPVGTDRMFFLHTLGDVIPGATPLGGGLYIGGDFDTMKSWVEHGYDTEGRVRFFFGYSGWSPGQLQQELRDGVWAVTPRPEASTLLTGADDVFWHKIVRTMGDHYRPWLFHPQNPSAN